MAKITHDIEGLDRKEEYNILYREVKSNACWGIITEGSQPKGQKMLMNFVSLLIFRIFYYFQLCTLICG